MISGNTVSNLQSDVAVTGNAITGTLAYIASGNLATDWGAGNFLALKFSNIPATATSVKVGLQPSQGTGLVEIIDDPDKNGIFKINDNTQSFMVVVTDGENVRSQAYDLSGLTLTGSGV